MTLRSRGEPQASCAVLLALAMPCAVLLAGKLIAQRPRPSFRSEEWQDERASLVVLGCILYSGLSGKCVAAANRTWQWC